MASTTRRRNPCSQCGKAAGILTCRGCGKDFCYPHVTEHRQNLSKQMEEITTDHDQLQQPIIEQRAEPKCHPLMKEIDMWEEESIAKVHQAAQNAREQLLAVVEKHRTKITKTLTHLTEELTAARNEDDYVETDLTEWTEKLEKLKADLAAAQVIDLMEDYAETPLVPSILIDGNLTDPFETWFGDIQTKKNGEVIFHGQIDETAAVCSTEEYSSGQYTFRLKIEHSHNTQGFYFGIVSIDRCAKLSSSASLNIFNTGYRLARSDHGCHQNGLSLFWSNMSGVVSQTEDILEVIIDCDRQVICLRNERNLDRYEHAIDINRCPFPWRMVISLYYAGDCIRLC